MLSSILIETFNTYIRIFPFILVAYILTYLIRKIKIKKHIKKFKQRSILAFMLGILSHGPIYAWYPLIKELEFSDNEKFAFMYLRAIKIPHIPVQLALLGPTLTLAINLYILFVGLIFTLLSGRITDINRPKYQPF